MYLLITICPTQGVYNTREYNKRYERLNIESLIWKTSRPLMSSLFIDGIIWFLLVSPLLRAYDYYLRVGLYNNWSSLPPKTDVTQRPPHDPREFIFPKGR